MENDKPEGLVHQNALCMECQTGAMRLEYITYFTWLNQELITVPSFPAWVCDVCGKREYDPRAIKWLNMLLNPETGRHSSSRRRRPGSGIRPARSQL
jgi:YgiT-type zinc finger domain-containing protein